MRIHLLVRQIQIAGLQMDAVGRAMQIAAGAADAHAKATLQVPLDKVSSYRTGLCDAAELLGIGAQVDAPDFDGDAELLVGIRGAFEQHGHEWRTVGKQIDFVK